MSYARGTDNHVCQVYDLIIDQVVEDLTPRLDEEGIDTSVLQSIKQLWKEKLMTSYDVGGGSGGGGGYVAGHHLMMRAALTADMHAQNPAFGGFAGLDGHSMPRNMHGLPHGSDVLLGHGIRVKPEGGLPQTDGPADDQEANCEERARHVEYPFQCPAAAAGRRKPRRGDVVYLTLPFGTEELCSELPQTLPTAEPNVIVDALTQLDGAGGGPKRRKVGDGGGYDEEGGDDDDDGDDGGGGNEEEELNSDDDDDDDDLGERQIDHLILCQFEKVTRQKQKWKGQFKDGMMRAKGRDYLFKKASGDMNFQK